MVIGDRLRVLREVKNYSQGEIERRTGPLRCYISRVKTATQSQLLKHWKSSHGRSKFRCTNCSTTVNSLPKCLTYLNAEQATILFGVIWASKRNC
jgi:hypothetical protein